MRSTRPRLKAAALLAILAAAGGSCGRQQGATDASSRPVGSAAASSGHAPIVTPPWAGNYSAEQKELLAAPLDTAIEQRATPIYPDLSRFTFIGEGPVQVPDDLVGYAEQVSQTLEDSPLVYVFRTGPASLANVHALWGPPPADAPDPWKRAENLAGQPSLVDALPSAEVAEKLERSAKAQPPESIALLREAAAVEGAPPGVHAMLADASLAAGDMATAEQAALAALRMDARYPHAQRVLAEVYLRRGETAKARESLARALAGYPAYARAWQVADVLMNRRLARPIEVPPPFLEVTHQGAVLVVSCPGPLCEGYAACKAAFRFEPEFRAAILSEAVGEPYHLSATEEVVCLEAGLGAHISAHDNASPGAPARPDPTAELLIRLAAEQGLSSYAMFEIVGRHRPEWARIAPEPVYEATVQYVLTRVLGTPQARPQPANSMGPGITASRSRDPGMRPGPGG